MKEFEKDSFDFKNEKNNLGIGIGFYTHFLRGGVSVGMKPKPIHFWV